MPRIGENRLGEDRIGPVLPPKLDTLTTPFGWTCPTCGNVNNRDTFCEACDSPKRPRPL